MTRTLILIAALSAGEALGQFQSGPGYVNFANLGAPPLNAPITDLAGVKLSGTGYFAQLYAADGWSAADHELTAKGSRVTFRTGLQAGYFLPSSVAVTDVPSGQVSVQVRAWTGPHTTYEAAVAAGVQAGKSRILRIQSQSVPQVPAQLIDATGPLTGFALGGPPAFSINDVVVAEGTNGTYDAVFSVTLFPAATQTVSVAYRTIDGTALAGADYESASGTLTFLAGETNKSITITVRADAMPESDEDFLVALENPVDAFLAAHSQARCIITEVQVAGISADIAVTFNTVLNHTYVLERADLGMENWTPVAGATNILGTGGLVTVVDKGGGCSTGRIYRARLLQ